MKPGDVYVGVIDFFSSVVPGAIAAFLLMTSGWIPPPRGWPPLERGSPEGWVIFLVAAYLLGQLISAIASAFLDPFFYDRIYVRWKRASDKYVRKSSTGPLRFRQICFRRAMHVIRKTNPDDELLKTAKTLKRRQLTEVANLARLKASDIGTTFRWAEAVVRAKSPEGATQAESLMAQSKLFRAVTLLVLPGALWLGRLNLITLGLEALLLLLCSWRFLTLRWEATKRIYEHFILASLLEPQLVRPNIAGPPRNPVPRTIASRLKAWIQCTREALRRR